MPSFDERLGRVESRFPRPGCDTCQDWTGSVQVTIDPVTGAETSRSRPDRCPDCGRVMELTRELHIVLKDGTDYLAAMVRHAT